jgi:hypothetical protein
VQAWYGMVVLTVDTYCSHPLRPDPKPIKVIHDLLIAKQDRL